MADGIMIRDDQSSGLFIAAAAAAAAGVTGVLWLRNSSSNDSLPW
jgi:hypothetical protein